MAKSSQFCGLRWGAVAAAARSTLAGSLVSACCGCPPVVLDAQSLAGPAPAASAPSGTVGDAEAYRWKNVAMLGGGFVTGVIFSPAEKDLIYARTDIGGAYRWNQADTSWIPITDQLTAAQSNAFGIESLAADPSDPNRVYMAVGTYTQDWAGAGAMMRSSDKGSNWTYQEMPIKMGGNENGRGNGERLAVDPHQPSTILFGSRKNGLWRSDDAGESWQEDSRFPVSTESLGVGITFVLFDHKSGAPGKPTPVIYAGFASTETGLYRSKDAGASWEPVPGQPKGVMPSHAGLDAQGVLYLSYGNLPGPSDVTSGAIWAFDPKPGKWTNITPLKPQGEDKFGYGGLSVHPSSTGMVMVTTIDRWGPGDEVFRTTNGGKSWQALGSKERAKRDDGGAKYLYWGRDTPSTTGWMADVDIDPFNPARAMYVTGQGIWGTTDADKAGTAELPSWKFINKNLEETVGTDLASPPSGPPLLSTVGDLGGFRHDDVDVAPPGGMFQNPIFGSGSSLDFAELAPNLVVRVGSHNQGQTGALSSDAGTSWTPFAATPAGKGGGEIAIAADGSAIVWAPKDGPVAYSVNQGASWAVSQGLPSAATLPDWAPVNFRLASDRVNPKKFYIYDALGGKAYHSDDGGQRFSESTTGLPSKPDWGLTATSAQAVAGFEGDVWLTTGNALYRSTDSGQTYRPVGGVAESISVGFGKGKDGAKYPVVYLIGKVAGTERVFRSEDAAESWVRINDDAHAFGSAGHIIGDPRVYGRVYLGTHGRGILYGDPQ